VSSDGRSTVRLFDLAKHLPAMALDAPGMLRNAPGLLVKPDDKSSVGLYFQRAAHKYPNRPFLRFEGTTSSGPRTSIRTVRSCASRAPPTATARPMPR
jgi:hypothetical protein